MEIETLPQRSSFAGNIKSAFSVLGYDISRLILNMKDNDDWKSGELNSMILLNSSAKKIVLTVMHNRTEINSFQSGDSVTIQIIEGKAKIQTSRDTITLEKGQLLILNDKEKFSLTSLEESSFVLTILTGSHKSIEN
jgi:quercetin dioxygenase-like cupin family protein